MGGAPASCERYGYTDPAWRRDLSGSTFEFVLGRRLAPRRSAAGRRGRARRLIIVEGETCAAPVMAGRATTRSAIGLIFNVVKLVSEGVWAGTMQRISKERAMTSARGAAMSKGEPRVRRGALAPPVGGTFHFEILVMPPLPKTCPKMVLSHEGVALV